MSTTTTTTAPRVLAVLVAHQGEEWVASATRALRAQAYPRLDVLAVDSASNDATAARLRERLGDDRVLAVDDNRGFGTAVAAALASEAASDADYILLLHDDLALAPDAVAHLVAALEAAPDVAIAGPKLRDWGDENTLQQAGMSADVFGRPDSGVERGELDQGQADGTRDVLYVSTAGMVLRTAAIRDIGGFDPRLVLFGDDLDLCWRAWLAGWRVQVVPDAIGWHAAAAANAFRPPFDAHPAQARYLAERNTLAAVLKNSGGPRLAFALLVGTLLAALKVAGLLLARRFSDAWATLRAGAWNVAQLPGTLRRRAYVQAHRTVADRELSRLFVTGVARLRDHADAVGDFFSGPSVRALDDAAERRGPDPLAERPALRFLRDRPGVVLGVPLMVVLLIGYRSLLGGGPLVGGAVAPWPDSPLDFLSAYVTPWGAGPLASPAFPSPAQAVLGLVSLIGFGSAWLAQHLVVLGLIPLAWLLASRAGRLVTSRPWPRALGATVYASGTPLLAALSEGRLGVLVLAALLPGLLLALLRAGDPRTAPGSGWRAAALLALGLVVVASFAPLESSVVVAVVLLAAVVALLRRAPGSGRAAGRLAAALGLAAAILSPWLFDLLRAGDLVGAGQSAALLTPLDAVLGRVGLEAVSPVLSWGPAVVWAAVVLGALVIGVRERPLLSGALLVVVAASAASSWLLARLAVEEVWGPAALLPGLAAVAALAVVAARWFRGALVLRALVGLGVVAGLVATLGLVAVGPWEGLRTDPQLVPAFVYAEQPSVGPYRVVRVTSDEGLLRWDVTSGTGPSMLDFGAAVNDPLETAIERSLAAAVAGVDAGAGTRLGITNVRYVVLDGSDAALEDVLARQTALDPVQAASGRVFRVTSWLPRAGLLPEASGQSLLTSGDPGDTRLAAVTAFQQTAPGTYTSSAIGLQHGVLVLTEGASPAWQASDGTTLFPRQDAGPVNAFIVEDAVDNPTYVVRAAGGLRRRLVVAGQLLVALLAVSLAIRPPGVTSRRLRTVRAGQLPGELAGLPSVPDELRADGAGVDGTSMRQGSA